MCTAGVIVCDRGSQDIVKHMKARPARIKARFTLHRADPVLTKDIPPMAEGQYSGLDIIWKGELYSGVVFPGPDGIPLGTEVTRFISMVSWDNLKDRPKKGDVLGLSRVNRLCGSAIVEDIDEDLLDS